MKRHGFTLIELLIVIAIIAILALIAIPNFLEAQTRAKVARSMADMRSIAAAVEAYAIDYNKTPPAAPGAGNLVFRYAYFLVSEPLYGINRNYCTPLTTPISYITSLPLDPFAPHEFTWVGSTGETQHTVKTDPGYGFISISGFGSDEEMRASPNYGVGNFLKKMDLARRCSVFVGAPDTGRYVSTGYVLLGAGPDRNYNYRAANFNGTPTTANTILPFNHFCQNNTTFEAFTGYNVNGIHGLIYPGMGTVQYDPTNGTVSCGDIIRLAGGGQ